MRCLALLCAILLGCDAIGADAKTRDAGDAPAPERGEDAGLVFPCLGEAGVRIEAGGNTKGPEPLCTNLNAEARCVGSKAQEDADRSCSSDADCVWAQSAPSCVDGCQTAAIVSKAGAKSVAAAVAELESEVCSRFEDAGCVYLASGCPQGAPADPVCNTGRCSALSGCALGPHRAATLLARGLPALAEDCATDDDCTVELPTACDWSCADAPAPIASVHTASYARLLQDVREACDGVALMECPIPSCDPPAAAQAACQNGTCVAR